MRKAEQCYLEQARQAKTHGGLEQQPAHLLPRKSVSTGITYEFGQDAFLRETYRNPWGFVRIGRILEDLDALAGNISFKHCASKYGFPLLVTASVDRMVLKFHPSLDTNMTLAGRVVWTGSSSLLIHMRCASHPPETCAVVDPWSDDVHVWLEANFTFVARDRATGRSQPVPPLLLEDPREKALFDRIQMQKDRRKALRLAQKKSGGTPVPGAAPTPPLAEPLLDREAVMKDLLLEGLPLAEMPTLADPYSVLMHHTGSSNTIICMPQHRNTANRIFGGFLMHRAFELAFATAYMFGGSRPQFQEIDEVAFLTPVDVGDLARFTSRVLYTRGDSSSGQAPSVHVEVLASVVRPEARESKMSNSFNFSFTYPDAPKEGFRLRRVLPSNSAEALRVVLAMERDLLQEDDDRAHAATEAASAAGPSGT